MIKNIIASIMLVCIFSGSCQPAKNVKSYYIKLRPFGISDVPRGTLFISLTDKYFPKNEYSINLILTDNSTLKSVVSFFESYEYPASSSENKYNEYGCFEVYEYKDNLPIADHMLSISESIKYLRAFIEALVVSKSDLKVINNLKNAVGEIDYR